MSPPLTGGEIYAIAQPDFSTWDPGGREVPNKHLRSIISCAMASGVNGSDMREDGDGSRTDLDSHANMVVCGRNTRIVGTTGKTVDVSPFSPDYPPLQVPVVDAVLQYDCLFSGKSYLLLVRNALSVPAMNNNLIPPFVMREAGIQVHDVPKIQVVDPTVDDHAILFKGTGFRIPLALWGTFSYFPTSKPSLKACDDLDDVYMLTPERWNPHSDSYARCEESMTDWEGNITAKKDRLRVVLDEIPDASEHGNVSHALISSVESKAVDSNIDSAIQRDHALRPAIADAPMCASDVSSVLLSVSPTLEPYPLFRRLEARAELSAMQVAIGATTCTRNPNEITILDNESCDVVPENGWMDDTTENYPEGDGLSQVEWIRETIVSGCIAGEISVDEVMQASATHASSSRY